MQVNLPGCRRSRMIKFQRQDCVLSNDYEELSIVKSVSSYIPAFVLMSLSAKRETTSHVTVGTCWIVTATNL